MHTKYLHILNTPWGSTSILLGMLTTGREPDSQTTEQNKTTVKNSKEQTRSKAKSQSKTEYKL